MYKPLEKAFPKRDNGSTGSCTITLVGFQTAIVLLPLNSAFNPAKKKAYSKRNGAGNSFLIKRTKDQYGCELAEKKDIAVAFYPGLRTPRPTSCFLKTPCPLSTLECKMNVPA